MKSSLLKSVAWWLGAFGLQPRQALRAMRGLRPFVKDYREFRAENERHGSAWKIELNRPCLADRFDQSGTAKGHYFHQDLLVARRIYHRNPARHVDVGSRVDGFVAHVASFRAIEVFDVRPIFASVPNVTFHRCDIMKLPEELHDYCDSLSCLHVLEHFGLGRYGDSIDVHGYVTGFGSLTRLLKTGGMFYCSVPIGRERIEFNGHRVFALKTLIALFSRHFELVQFSYVDDSGDLHEGVPLSPENVEHSFDLDYGCGIFELQKIPKKS